MNKIQHVYDRMNNEKEIMSPESISSVKKMDYEVVSGVNDQKLFDYELHKLHKQLQVFN